MDPLPNRETWLMALAARLWPRVEEAGGKRPERFRVSCGWPSTKPLGQRNRRIGECWSAGSEDKSREIFISPALADPVEVADTLLHEMIHAAPPAQRRPSRSPFPRIAKRLGLEGKPTEAFASPRLAIELKALTAELGPYPHAKLDELERKRQTARQMLVECPDCGCKVRMARSWIATYLPTCGCGTPMISTEYDLGAERLIVREAHILYATEDGRYELRTRGGSLDGSWWVTDLEGGRWAVRRNRADALAFLAAVRNGETDFPESAEALGDDEDESWLDDDEDETVDYPEDQSEG